MRLSAASVAALVAVAAGLAVIGEEQTPPEPGVSVVTERGMTRFTAVLPGRLLGVALPRVAGGRREVVALVRPQAASSGDAEPAADPCDERPAANSSQPARLLVRLDAGLQRIDRLRDDLPGWAKGVQAADLDGDGADELLLVGTGTIQSLRANGGRLAALGPEPLLSDPAIDAASVGLPDAGLLPEGLRLFPLHTLGSVRFYGGQSAGGPWTMALEEPLPVKASRQGEALRLRSPLLRQVGLAPGGGALLAAGPGHHGTERLRTILIDPSAPPGKVRTEAWSRLPEPEQVIDSSFGQLDGRPALVVTTRSALKLKFLEEKLLRLYFLDEVDRSRSGASPVLATESQANLWQTTVSALLDVDGDGRQDLVLGYWKGLKDSSLILDAYLRQRDGSFATSPRTTRFDVEGANRAVLGYGRDLDGDGRADLMLNAGARMIIYAGSASSSQGRNLVETTPRWSTSFVEPKSHDFDMDISFSGGGLEFETSSKPYGSAIPVDLDGDGRAEIVAPEPDARPGVIHLIRLQP